MKFVAGESVFYKNPEGFESKLYLEKQKKKNRWKRQWKTVLEDDYKCQKSAESLSEEGYKIIRDKSMIMFFFMSTMARGA